VKPERKVEPLPAPDRLDSWKEIAGYLKRSERTVRRWEAKEELPVHRLQHDKRGSVYAYTRELDAWRASRRVVEGSADELPSRRIRARWWWAAGAAVLVAIAIIGGLRVWSNAATIAERGTANDEAWRLFQRARTGGNAGRVQFETGLSYYRQAIQIDPGFARAWAALASARLVLTWFGEQPPSGTMAEARREAEQARQLDPSLGEPWRVLGFINHYFEWNHTVAESQFRRAIELSPDAISYCWYGDFLTDMRRFDEARAAYERAQQVNPRWGRPPVFAANILTFTGRPALAVVQQRRALEIDPLFGFGNHFLGRSLLAGGDWANAIEYLRRSNYLMGAVPFTLGDLGYALAASGTRDEAEHMRQDLLGRREKGYYPAFPIAQIELGLGNTDAALDWLERAAGERHTGFYLPSVDPIYDTLRSQPRFRAIMAQMNLPTS
jgi:tetratricopeptide (TPR) repeat protein